MKIAITGSNGFLGSHIAKAAINAGHETIALIRSGADLRNLPENRKLFIERFDYKNLREIDNSVSKLKAKYGKIDVFIHNAGLTVSLNRDAYFNVNSVLTQNLIQILEAQKWLKKEGKWFQISSYAAAGPEGYDIPISLYGQSKLEAEKHLQKSKLNHVIFRPTGIYGSGDVAFLPLFRAAKWGIYPLLGPQKQRITMIHGLDVAKFVIDQVGEVVKNKTYHLSDGRIYSHFDFKEALEHAFCKKIRLIKMPTGFVKSFLKLNDAIASMTSQSTGVTFEKYNEISKNWNLSSNFSLNHPQLDAQYDLKEGFTESLNYYKSVNLI